MKLTLSLISIAIASASFSQTMGDPVATLTITNSVNNSSEYFGLNEGGVFHYGFNEFSAIIYAYNPLDKSVSGGSTATWRITRTSQTNPGDLGVIFKVQTRCKVRTYATAYFGTKTWTARSTIQGLAGAPNRYLAEMNGSNLPQSPYNQSAEDVTLGYPAYENKDDSILQLSSSNWSRVGTTDVWEAFITIPVAAIALAQGKVGGSTSSQLTVSYQGDSKIGITFPGFP